MWHGTQVELDQVRDELEFAKLKTDEATTERDDALASLEVAEGNVQKVRDPFPSCPRRHATDGDGLGGWLDQAWHRDVCCVCVCWVCVVCVWVWVRGIGDRDRA